MVDEGDVETAEPSQAATHRLQMANRGAHCACDGLLLHEEQIGLRGACLAFGLAVKKGGLDLIGIGRKGNSGGTFNHSKGCNDIAVGVGDLVGKLEQR